MFVRLYGGKLREYASELAGPAGLRYADSVTCADCDLSGRCPCVMRRLERLRAKGLMPTGAHAEPSCFVEECQPIASNQATFEAAMNLLRDLNKR